MKRLTTLLLGLVFFIALSSVCTAETLKVGVFDLKKIMTESKTVQGYRHKIDNDLLPKKKAFAAKQEAGRQMEERLKKEGASMATSDRRTLEEKLSSDIRDLKRMKEDFDAELQKIDRDLTQKAFEEINKVVKDIAVKESFTIIFEKNAAGIVFLKEGTDITEKVIKAYDKK
jgi:outer membrane protein